MVSQTPSTVQDVLDELDHLTIQLQVELAAGESWSCRRAAWRRPLRVRCELWSLKSRDQVVQAKGLTRNISSRGISLISSCKVPAGYPIEIKVLAPGKPAVYLAGIVRHCRSASERLHEIGVHLYASQNSPVFHNHPFRAALALPWLREALFLVEEKL